MSQLSVEEKRLYYQKKTHLFQLETSIDVKDELSIRKATQILRDSFVTKEPVSCQCRGLKITNQLNLENTNKVILYIHGAWSGLFQNHPRINGYLSVDAVRGAISRFALLKFNKPVIAFQLPTEPTGTLNFGLEDDQMVLSFVVEKLIQLNPQVEIILYGVCVGALRIQTWISEPKNVSIRNIHSLVLESPLVSVKQLVSFSENDNINEWMYYLFSLLLPSYKRHPLTKKVNCQKPTLLFGCDLDRLCTKKDLDLLQENYFTNSKIVFLQEKWNHGELFKSSRFRQEVMLSCQSGSPPTTQTK